MLHFFTDVPTPPVISSVGPLSKTKKLSVQNDELLSTPKISQNS